MSANTITLAPALPLWLIAVLFCLGLVLVFVQYNAIRSKISREKALIVSLLRLGTIFLLVAFALNPSLTTRKTQRIPPSVAVILDTSESMGQPGGGRSARLDEARTLLTAGERPLLEALREKFEVNLFSLADSLKPLGDKELAGLKAHGGKGDIAGALETLGGKNDAAILLSDGNLRESLLLDRRLPTITVPLGSPATYRDLLIKSVKAPSLAFKGREIVIDFIIKNYGYTGLTLPVLLEDQDKQLAKKIIQLRDSPGEVGVTLSFVPDKAGRQNVSISVPGQEGESILANNRIDLSIQVLRDKIRVLMVSGSPSMNYRLIRAALLSDPSIDLLSFVFLRTPSDILNVPKREQSLIPFPVETLFTKELTGFDLLVFDNFNYSLYLRPDYLEHVRDFIKEGGGFAMVGGPFVYHEGRLGLSPIGDILPFRFVEKEFYRRSSPVRVRMTREGAGHPLLRIFDDFQQHGEKEPDFWKDLAPLDGINLTEAKRPATVLLESAEGLPWPILTISEYGKGRILFLTTDYAWKWYMGLVAGGKGNQPFFRLVHRMIRWLGKDPNLETLQIILPETANLPGREIDVKIRTVGEAAFKPSGPAVAFSVFDPGGGRIESKLKSTDQPGENVLSFTPPRKGVYRIKAETTSGQREETVIVSGVFADLDAAPDHERLKKIARSTGGRFVTGGVDLSGEIEARLREKEKQFVEETLLPIWATPVVMVLVLSLLSTEWYFRRRWGLV